MTKTRKTERSVEIHELYVIRSKSGSLPPLCAECATPDSIMVPAEQAAILAHVSVRMIYRWVESATVHYNEGQHGSLAVCLKSLPVAVNQFTSSQISRSDKSENGDEYVNEES